MLSPYIKNFTTRVLFALNDFWLTHKLGQLVKDDHACARLSWNWTLTLAYPRQQTFATASTFLISSPIMYAYMYRWTINSNKWPISNWTKSFVQERRFVSKRDWNKDYESKGGALASEEGAKMKVGKFWFCFWDLRNCDFGIYWRFSFATLKSIRNSFWWRSYN